ncbi:winged helix-turn-helix domain-containing protein [Geoglobus sp.]
MKESWSKHSDTLEKSREYHKRYQIAVSSPLRRKILRLVKDGRNEDEIKRELGLDDRQLEYHLKVLEWGHCIDRSGGRLEITKEGMVVDYLD